MTRGLTVWGRVEPAFGILGWVVVLLALANVASLLLRNVLLDRLDVEVEASFTQEVDELQTLALGRNHPCGSSRRSVGSCPEGSRFR